MLGKRLELLKLDLLDGQMASLNLSEQALPMLLHQGFKLYDRWLVTLVDVDKDLG